ncbi:TonB-dependent receptor plug domain-containing protein [Pelagicoccus mobilis]|uniref:TonB-dependent receptor plug domain-containing protein n=1 Tax=Pelagicoccus mobilis TaxID=415221 RepID=A0A934S3P0_9BACT|nr:TonB-dependent receptor plug domain-containing protein [Pelagicoccus mobilis]MBK1880514.1 TonB-dependent receptor plug domain-containing protein [Pelagicoccus mobilis]
MKRMPRITPSGRSFGYGLLSLLLSTGTCHSSFAQESEQPEEEVFELSPFEINADSDRGYAATQTLAGTRLNSSLRDVGSAITIMTPEFLEDIGAANFEEALIYAPNTDTYEAGIINTPDGTSTRDANQYSVRGLQGNSLSRDFFRSLYRADLYNTERLTFSRGPNAILFGIAQPGGVTNALSKRAKYHDIFEVAHRFDDEGSQRVSLDFNKAIIEDVLAVRLAALDYDTRYWREPEFEKGDRQYVAMRLNPFANGSEFMKDLMINASYEQGDTRSQRLGRNEPIYDRVTPWIEAGRPMVDTIEKTTGNTQPGIEPIINRPSLRVIETNIIPGSQVPTLSWRRMARGARVAPEDGDQSRNSSLLDESILPFDVNYLGGTRRYNDDFDTFQFVLNKKFGQNLYLEASYNKQKYNRVSIEEVRGPSLNVDVNNFLPNGEPNPNAGRYFIEGPIVRNQPFGINELTSKRISASYDLDLTGKDSFIRHLGKFRMAAALESEDNKLDRQWVQLSNVTPAATNAALGLAGPRAFKTKVSHPWNRANFMMYLDPANGYTTIPASSEQYTTTLYAGDPISPELMDENGVSLAFIADFPGFNDLTETRSDVFALQQFLFENRLILTYGTRKDEQDSWSANSLILADTDPVTGIRPDPRPYNPKDAADSQVTRSGRTETMGFVAYPIRPIGLFYNESDNFVPVGQATDIYGEVFPNQTGEGKDYGIKFFLLEDKLTASITKFETSMKNQETGYIRAGARGVARPFTASQTDLWEHVAAYTEDDTYLSTPYKYDLGPFWNALQDLETTGVEFQMTYNPTKQWRIMFNYSEQEGVYENLGTRLSPYFNEFVPSVWQDDWSDIPLDSSITYQTGEVETVGELLAATQADAARIQSLAGTSDTRQPLSSMNLVTNYKFAQDSKLKGWSVGGSARWRDDRFLGFPFQSDGVTFDPQNPYLGGSHTTIDFMLRYNRKIFNNVNWTFQVNVKNLLDDTDLLPLQTDGLGQGEIVRWGFRTPRSIQITNTLKF